MPGALSASNLCAFQFVIVCVCGDAWCTGAACCCRRSQDTGLQERGKQESGDLQAAASAALAHFDCCWNCAALKTSIECAGCRLLQIVECGALPILIQMLRAEDVGVHYEAVGVIGNLVHSSQNIKRKVSGCVQSSCFPCTLQGECLKGTTGWCTWPVQSASDGAMSMAAGAG